MGVMPAPSTQYCQEHLVVLSPWETWGMLFAAVLSSQLVFISYHTGSDASLPAFRNLTTVVWLPVAPTLTMCLFPTKFWATWPQGHSDSMDLLFYPVPWSQQAHLKSSPLLWNLNISLDVIPLDPLPPYHFSGFLISNLAPRPFDSIFFYSCHFTSWPRSFAYIVHITDLALGFQKITTAVFKELTLLIGKKENKHISDKLSG